MSLSKLPDLVKRKICSFLDFNEIKKLEQTNKRNQAFLKRYKLDKPNIYALSFVGVSASNIPIKCAVMLEKDGEWIDLPNIDSRAYQDIHTSKVLDLMNKFNSIYYLHCYGIWFYDSEVWATVRTKIENGRLSALLLDNLSRETVVHFLKQFKYILFEIGVMDWDIINDELFMELSKNGTTLLLKGFKLPTQVDISDVTLDTLLKFHPPKNLSLECLITKFTFGRIKKLIETAVTSEMTDIHWNFGIMKEDQYNEVRKFMHEDFEEWAGRMNMPLHFGDPSDHFRRASAGSAFYAIYHRDKDADEFSIEFAVKKPDDVIQEAMEYSDDEDESDAEEIGEDSDDESGEEEIEEDSDGEDDVENESDGEDEEIADEPIEKNESAKKIPIMIEFLQSYSVDFN